MNVSGAMNGRGFLAELGDVIEWLRPWVSTGALVACVALLGLILKHQIALKRVKIEADTVANADEADIRDHYADEVRQLRDRMDQQAERHRSAIEASEAKHRACEEAREDLRDKVYALKDQVMGLVRLILANSAAGTLILSQDQVSDVVREAAERVDKLFQPKDEGK